MIANYSATLRQMFPNAQIIIDRFHIIQLAMKAAHITCLNLQRMITNKHSRIYKRLKANWQFSITDHAKIDLTQARCFKGINKFMYPQDALQLFFELSQQFKQSYEVYQSILTTQQTRTFTEFAAIIEQYELNQQRIKSFQLSKEPNWYQECLLLDAIERSH